MAKQKSEVSPAQARRYRQAAKLIRKWMNEESQYDAKDWALFDEVMNEGGLTCGEPKDEDVAGHKRTRRNVLSGAGRKSVGR